MTPIQKVDINFSELMARLLDLLNPKERDVIERRFSLGGKKKEARVSAGSSESEPFNPDVTASEGETTEQVTPSPDETPSPDDAPTPPMTPEQEGGKRRRRRRKSKKKRGGGCGCAAPMTGGKRKRRRRRTHKKKRKSRRRRR